MRIYIRRYYESVTTPDELIAVFIVLDQTHIGTLLRKYGKKLHTLITTPETFFALLNECNPENRDLLTRTVNVQQCIQTEDDLATLLMTVRGETDEMRILEQLDLSGIAFTSFGLSCVLEWLADPGKKFVLETIPMKAIIRNLADFCYVATHLHGEMERTLLRQYLDVLKHGITGSRTLVTVLNSLTVDGDAILMEQSFIRKLKIDREFCEKYLPPNVYCKL